jgi:hypothetical protein
MTDEHTPAPGTKAALEAENANLRRQLAQLGGARNATPTPVPYLTEGDRQELLSRGVVNSAGGGGRVTLTTAADLFPGVDLSDATDAAREAADAEDTAVAERGDGRRGFDYVYPSVAPGLIDPAVAGTPGINGPSADQA